MSLQPFAKKGAGIGVGKADSTGAKKRTADDITFDDEDDVFASHDVKRRQQSGSENIPSATRLQPQSRPPKSTTIVVSAPAEYGFKPANRTSGVVDTESSRSDDDDGDEARGGQYPMDTRGLKEEEGVTSSDRSDESFEDFESEIYTTSEDDNNGDGVNRQGGLSDEGNSPAAHSSFEEMLETPSGKPYNMLRNEDGKLERLKGALFPDGYQLQDLPSFPGHRFICPVRDCRKLFDESVGLRSHFSAAHPRCHFVDNLDKDGTLTVQERVSNGRSMVVSQRPLDSNAPALKSPSLPRKRPGQRKSATKIDRIENVEDINDAEYDPAGPTEHKSRARSIRSQSERSTLTGPSPSSSANARAAQSLDGTPVEPSAVNATEIRSDVLTYIKHFVGEHWLSRFQNEENEDNKDERSAFLQAITLPRRNKVDEDWLKENKKSHPSIFTALISIVIHVVGVRATPCNACEKRSTERKRNCMVLPPEAEDMRELQGVIGRRCVNCFLLRSSHCCVFVSAGISPVVTSNGVKQTPISAPTPRPTSATMLANRPGSYIATGLSTPTPAHPIPKSPIPVPVLPGRPQAPQAQDLQASIPTEESDQNSGRRSGLRSARDLAVEIDSHGDSVEDHGRLDAKNAYSDAATSTDEPASAAATTVASSSVSCTTPIARASFSKLCTVVGEITQLPTDEWSKMYPKVVTMLEMVASEAPSTAGTAAPGKYQGYVSHQSQVTAADGWEIAPGRLVSGGEPVAFSTSSLCRELVCLASAQYITPTEKVLNKHIAALDHLRIKPEDDWECRFSVTKGLIRAKMGDLENNIVYGGVWLVKHECIVTNIVHDESHIQVWWNHVDE